MKANAIRWICVFLMLGVLSFLVSAPAMAEVTPLDLDQTVPGAVPSEGGWTRVSGKDALTDEGVLSFGTAKPCIIKYDKSTGEWSETDKEAKVSEFDWIRYEDPSISVRAEYATLIPAYKNAKIQSSVTYIKVTDPSQVRTAMSNDNYDKRNYVSAESMARHVHSVAAVNGDFFKYHYNVGYVVRQGVFYRDKLNGKRDLLLIDNHGDFHAVFAAKSEDVQAFQDSLPEGRSVVNTFTLGPVLVQDGAARTISETSVADSGEFQWCYAQQRVAVVQVGELEYAIVETYGKTNGSMGLTLQEFADYIAWLFPDCRMAYNLDGGGSTNVVIGEKRIEKTPGHRDISDILYFASAWTEE